MTATNELTIINENTIKDKIYVIRGIPVMLDKDLTLIYGYSVKALNQQVKNNVEKFPSDMVFRLTSDDIAYINIRSNILTGSHRNVRFLPYALTEQGIYMLMTILKGGNNKCLIMN